jgi:hypothetical protein
LTASGVVELSPTERELAVCPAARSRPTRHAPRLHGYGRPALISQKAPEMRRGNRPGFSPSQKKEPNLRGAI